MQYTSQITPIISQLSQELDQYQFFIQNSPSSPEVQLNLRRKSYLKSSLFSAKIEGNRLTLEQVNEQLSHSKTKEKLEISNILSALNLIASDSSPHQLTVNFIKKLHLIALNQLNADTGRFRREISAIFNQAGVAIYLTPDPKEIEPELNKLISLSKTKNSHRYITAAISHFWFEKIHPFADGNGRVGRLLIHYLLDNRSANFHGLLNFEEEIEKTRSDYYYFLQHQSKDITEFTEYLLVCFCTAGKKAVELIKQAPTELTSADLLLPRRQEILNLLHDHEYLSFDQIHRRFYAINPSTLRNDLRQLMDKDFVVKIGSTRGALYKVKS